MVMTPVNGNATSIKRATASIRGLFSANIKIAAHSKARTSASWVLMDRPAAHDGIRADELL
jgi:hypothetical protein